MGEAVERGDGRNLHSCDHPNFTEDVNQTTVTTGAKLHTVSPRMGSTLAGTEMTFSGRGFATCTQAEDSHGVFGGGLLSPVVTPCTPETVDGVEMFNMFKTYGGIPFDAIIVRASWDEIVAVSTLISSGADCFIPSDEDADEGDGAACDMTEPAVLRVGVGPEGLGSVVGTGTASTPNGGSPSSAFDGSTSTVWDAWSRWQSYYPAQTLYYDVGYVTRVDAYAFYDNGWECPFAWELRGSVYGTEWDVLDSRVKTYCDSCGWQQCADAWQNYTIAADKRGLYRYFGFFTTDAYPGTDYGDGADGVKIREFDLTTTPLWSTYEYDNNDNDDYWTMGGGRWEDNTDELDDGVLPWGSLGDDGRIPKYRPFHQRSVDATPFVTHVDPNSGTIGTTVSIFGEGFDANASLTGVAIGGVECAVEDVTVGVKFDNASELWNLVGDEHSRSDYGVIRCIVGNATSPGKYGVMVRTAAGLAKPIPPYTFNYISTIANVTPAVGSFEGGTLITVTGAGFSQELQVADTWACA